MRDIHAGEELTTDYAMFDDYEGSMDCTCGRPNCRRRIEGRDWQRPDLQEATADTSPGTSTESGETIAWTAQRPEPARQGLFGRYSSRYRVVVSTGFLITLGLAVASLATVRLLVPGLPLSGRTTTLRFTEVVVVGVGLAALAFHCVAMFFPDVAERLPATAGAISDIRGLDTASIVWYGAPALLVMFGLRRLHRGALTVIAVALLSVGVTMYNGGPLDQHLFVLFIGVVSLAAVLAVLVRPRTNRTTV